MSLDNFIPQIWSASIIRAMEKALVFGSIANRNYEGEIRGAGDKVKINQIGEVEIKDYTKNSTVITPEELDSASVTLEIDQAKYFAFKVDDIDTAQANAPVMQAAMAEAAYRLADAADQYIASLYAGAGVTSGLGTTGTPLDITAKATAGGTISVIEWLSLLGKALDENNVPTQGRFLIVPPAVHQKLVLANVLTTDTQQDALMNGVVGYRFGFDIRMSNNVAKLAGDKYKVMAGTTQAISFADQIASVEAYRPESSFSDAVKGLHVYGAKVVRAKALAVSTVTVAAEA
jgi:hypothetical protein